MAIEQLNNPSDQPEGKRIVYLVEREGGIHTKEFGNRRKCRKYLKRRHDSVVSYKEYLITEDGRETFVKEGTFSPGRRNRSGEAMLNFVVSAERDRRLEKRLRGSRWHIGLRGGEKKDKEKPT